MREMGRGSGTGLTAGGAAITPVKAKTPGLVWIKLNNSLTPSGAVAPAPNNVPGTKAPLR